MGQKSSHFAVRLNKTKLPLSWVLGVEGRTTRNPNPEQPIKFQYKTKRKEERSAENNSVNALNNLSVKSNNLNEVKCKIIKTQNAPVRTKSEPSLATDRNRERHRRRKKSTRLKNGRNGSVQQFGYEIGDVDAFLCKVGIISS